MIRTFVVVQKSLERFRIKSLCAVKHKKQKERSCYHEGHQDIVAYIPWEYHERGDLHLQVRDAVKAWRNQNRKSLRVISRLKMKPCAPRFAAWRDQEVAKAQAEIKPFGKANLEHIQYKGLARTTG